MKETITVKASVTDTLVEIEIPTAVVTVVQPDPIIKQTPVAPPVNQAPKVDGSTTNITLPVNVISLSSVANDPDGVISKYEWTKVSGPSAGYVQNPNVGNTTFVNAVAGTYVFRITVTDDKGATSFDEVTSVVNPAVVISPNPGTLLLQSDFSNGFTGFTTYQLGRGTIANDPTNSANKTFRAEVRRGDAPISSGYRSELVPANVSDTGDMWYGYKVYHQTLGQGGGGHSVQWHPGNSTGSATLALFTDYGSFNIVRTLNNGQWYQSDKHPEWPVKKVVLNRWYDIVWHVKWSTGSDGLIEVWIDGAKYYSYSGKNMESVGVYFKFGMNRWAYNNDWVIFYDNLKIARNANYDTVAPKPLA